MLSKPIKAKPKPIYHVVRGVLHPPGSQERDYWGYDIRASEIDDAVRLWRYIPVFLEHEHKKGHFGWVSHMEKGAKNELIVTMVINSASDQGGRALAGLMNGSVKGLSLGQRSKMNEDKTKVLSITPLEVSLCTQGARSGSHIHWFTDSTHKPIYSQFYKSEQEEIKKKMATDAAKELERIQEQIKQLEMQKQQVEAAVTTGSGETGAAAGEDELAKYRQALEMFKNFAPGGDVNALAALMVEEHQKKQEEAIRQHEQKLAEFRQTIQQMRETGGLGPDPSRADEMASRLTEAPPNVIDVFANMASNYHHKVHELETERSAKKQSDAALEAERRKTQALEEKLKYQQGLGLSTNAERFNTALNTATRQPTHPPANTYQYQPPPQQQSYGAGAVPVQRNASLFETNKLDPQTAKAALSSVMDILKTKTLNVDNVEFKNA